MGPEGTRAFALRRFIPATGHGPGFNDLKIIWCRELIRAIEGLPDAVVSLAEGLQIEKSVNAMARSCYEQRWIDVANE